MIDCIIINTYIYKVFILPRVVWYIFHQKWTKK